MTGNTRAIACMVGAMACYASSDALMKAIGAHVPSGQALFLRGWVVMALILAIAHRRGDLAAWRGILSKSVAGRGFAEYAGSLAYLSALPHVELATAFAATMSAPLLTLPLAVLVLGERFGWRRALAVIVGFSGALLVIKPDVTSFDIWAILLVAGALGFATRDVITRGVPRAIPTTIVAAMTVAIITLGALPFGLAQGWVMPSFFDVGALIASAVAVTMATQLLITATRSAEISLIAGFRYTGMLWAVLIGFLAWGELPDALGWTGIALVVAAGLYALYRERSVVSSKSISA